MDRYRLVYKRRVERNFWNILIRNNVYGCRGGYTIVGGAGHDFMDAGDGQDVVDRMPKDDTIVGRKDCD